MDVSQNCHCPCGETRFNVSGRPLLRAFCHCTICQAFYQAPFSDITFFRVKDVVGPEEQSVAFNKIWIPPFIRRGKCVKCGKPAINYLEMFPMPRLAIVASANIYDKSFVPAPALHIFYDTRVADIADGLPKYSGYLKSEFAIGHRVMASLLR